jgi:hypothetical protein
VGHGTRGWARTNGLPLSTPKDPPDRWRGLHRSRETKKRQATGLQCCLPSVPRRLSARLSSRRSGDKRERPLILSPHLRTLIAQERVTGSPTVGLRPYTRHQPAPTQFFRFHCIRCRASVTGVTRVTSASALPVPRPGAGRRLGSRARGTHFGTPTAVAEQGFAGRGRAAGAL